MKYYLNKTPQTLKELERASVLATIQLCTLHKPKKCVSDYRACQTCPMYCFSLPTYPRSEIFSGSINDGVSSTRGQNKRPWKAPGRKRGIVCMSAGSAASFSEPTPPPCHGGGVLGTRVCIEYCTGCRWGLRASWIATELLVTFCSGELGEVAVRPSNTSGTFRIWVVPEVGEEQRIWCRKEVGRFPELKELKQLIRDAIAPTKDLGHSDCASTAGDISGTLHIEDS